MQVHAFLGTHPVIVVGSTDMRWKTVEVAFAGGTVESAVGEHGLEPQIQDGTNVVAIGDLSGSGGRHPSGLAMTVTFSSDTNMDGVRIDFTSPSTAITTDDHANYPTVEWDDLANGYVASIVQDARNEIYAFAPGLEINTVEVTNDMSTLSLTSRVDGLSVFAGSYADTYAPEPLYRAYRVRVPAAQGSLLGGLTTERAGTRCARPGLGRTVRTMYLA